jgi:hypothetical protein
MEIRYTPWGLANNFGDYIELNEHLKEYPKLHDMFLKHELQHTNKAFSKKDFLLDLQEQKASTFELLRFMFKYPKSLLQFAPFYKKGNAFVYDINLCIFYFVISGIISLSVFLALR